MGWTYATYDEQISKTGTRMNSERKRKRCKHKSHKDINLSNITVKYRKDSMKAQNQDGR